MTEQGALFYEDYFSALRDDVAALGGAKEVGRWFWPEKDPLAARNKLNDALNAERRERLTDEQERLIMRRAREARGYSAGLAYICDDTGFERPKAITPEDQRDRLADAILTASATLERALKAAERLPQSSLQSARTS